MSAELDEKWAELVAVGKAKWVQGMLRIAPDPAPPPHADPWDDGPRLERYEEDAPYIEGWSDGPWYPVWDDPGTLGCLVGQVRTRWGRPKLVAYYAPLASGQGWYVGDRFCGDRDYPVVETPSDTEAEALLRALEVAP